MSRTAKTETDPSIHCLLMLNPLNPRVTGRTTTERHSGEASLKQKRGACLLLSRLKPFFFAFYSLYTHTLSFSLSHTLVAMQDQPQDSSKPKLKWLPLEGNPDVSHGPPFNLMRSSLIIPFNRSGTRSSIDKRNMYHFCIG